MSSIEDVLRRVGPPAEVPERFHAASAEAALGDGSVVAATNRALRGAWWRRRPAVAIAGAVAACVVLAVALVMATGGSDRYHTTVALSGVAPQFSNASATFELGAEDGQAMRTAVLTVKNLPPAPAGSYYDMWMTSGAGDDVSLMAFDTNKNGSITVRTSIPADIPWKRCVVSLKSQADPSAKPQAVLKSS